MVKKINLIVHHTFHTLTLKKEVLTMRRLFIASILLLFALPIIAVAKTTVEVGKEDGCNLTPIFQGQETYYGIEGGSESAGLIEFGIDATITNVVVDPRSEVLKNDKGLAIDIPTNTIKYSIKVFYRPEKAGLIEINISTNLVDATIWLKVVPQGTPLPWDVNWDGVLSMEDATSMLSVLQKPTDSTTYWRCDVDKNGKVERYDLYLVRQKLGLNPGDYNDDGIVDIRDFAFTYSQRNGAPAPSNYPFIISQKGIKFDSTEVKEKATTTWGGLKNAQ